LYINSGPAPDTKRPDFSAKGEIFFDSMELQKFAGLGEVELAAFGNFVIDFRREQHVLNTTPPMQFPQVLRPYTLPPAT
jgi:hypothetical protein